MNYTLESAQNHRAFAQTRLENHYTELTRCDAMSAALTKSKTTLRDSEQIKKAESKIRSIGLHMTQLRDSYIPRTREACLELDREIEAMTQQQAAQAAKGAGK